MVKQAIVDDTTDNSALTSSMRSSPSSMRSLPSSPRKSSGCNADVDPTKPGMHQQWTAEVARLHKDRRDLAREERRDPLQESEPLRRIEELETQLSALRQQLETSKGEKRQAQEEALEFQYQLEASERRISLLVKEEPGESLCEKFKMLKLQHDTLVIRAGELSMQLAESRAANDELRDELLTVSSSPAKSKRPSFFRRNSAPPDLLESTELDITISTQSSAEESDSSLVVETSSPLQIAKKAQNNKTNKRVTGLKI